MSELTASAPRDTTLPQEGARTCLVRHWLSWRPVSSDGRMSLTQCALQRRDATPTQSRASATGCIVSGKPVSRRAATAIAHLSLLMMALEVSWTASRTSTVPSPYAANKSGRIWTTYGSKSRPSESESVSASE